MGTASSRMCPRKRAFSTHRVHTGSACWSQISITMAGPTFLDFDNDGWPDILLCNGHVYPEIGDTGTEAGYRQRKVLYHNLGNGSFRDVSLDAGPGILEMVAGRGLAIGDFDNDGDLDVAVNCVNDYP